MTIHRLPKELPSIQLFMWKGYLQASSNSEAEEVANINYIKRASYK